MALLDELKKLLGARTGTSPAQYSPTQNLGVGSNAPAFNFTQPAVLGKSVSVATPPVQAKVATPSTSTSLNTLKNLGVGSNGGGSNVNTQDLRTQAERDNEIQKQGIMSRLSLIRDEGNRLRGSAKGVFDSTVDNIKKTYESLKDLSKKKLQSSLDTLNQEDMNVQNVYGRTAGNSRRAMESALTRNRMLHRAMGSLGSSFYTNAQGDTTNQGMNTINDVAVEEAGKRSAIGTRKADTEIDFNQNDIAIGNEEANLTSQAQQEYNKAIGEADFMEKNFNIDTTEALQDAENKLASSLSAIRNYVQSTQPVSINTSPMLGKINDYNVKAPIQNILDQNKGVQGAEQFIAGASPSITPNNANVANGSSYLSLLKKRLQKDPYGYFQNLA